MYCTILDWTGLDGREEKETVIILAWHSMTDRDRLDGLVYIRGYVRKQRKMNAQFTYSIQEQFIHSLQISSKHISLLNRSVPKPKLNYHTKNPPIICPVKPCK